MKVLSLSYNFHLEYRSPDEWLDRISFYEGVLQRLGDHCEVHEVHFIGFEGICVVGKVTHHFLKPSFLFRPLPIRFHRYVKSLRPDVVIVHGLIVPWQVILLRLQLGRTARIFIQHHSEKLSRFPRTLLQRMADKYIDAYLFTSSEQAEPWLNKGIIADRAKVKQLFEGSSAFGPSDRSEARKRTGITGNSVYLWVGRLISIKDPLTVVRAFVRFLRQGNKADLYMIFQTTDLLDDVKALLEVHADVASSIHLVGKVDHDELVYWYNSADFFVLGSYDEATNISLCEAMSCGCIPILTDIPAFRAMTGNGKCGLLFPPGNEERLIEALEESYGLDLTVERQKVLDQFHGELSFTAISGRLNGILSGKEENSGSSQAHS